MVEFFYTKVKTNYYQKKKYWLYQYRFFKILVNILFPVFCKSVNRKATDIGSEIVVSLTSFPARIDTVWMTITSLLRQTHKPNRVILWLNKEQFEGIVLPRNLTRLKKYGLEIKWCDDLKPHKKYFYCMQSYSDKCIVIADDDIFYPKNHLKILWENYKKHPDCIIANKTHHIEYNMSGECLKYNDWKNQVIKNPSYLLIPIGCNGVLYPPCLLNKTLLLDKTYIINKTLYTDDLWLKICAVLSKVKTYSCVENELVYFDCIRAGKVGLWKSNTKGINRNDTVWNQLLCDFPSVNELLLKEWLSENEINNMKFE